MSDLADNSQKDNEKMKEVLEQFAQENGSTVVHMEAGPKMEDLFSKISALEASISEANDRTLRAMAEMENVRKRSQRDVEEARQFAVSKFAGELISVLENLYRALDAIPEDVVVEHVKSLREGVEMTRKEMVMVFERFGMKRVFPLGEKFDHNLHQAMSQMAEPGKESGIVLQVLQAGYTLHERLLRPALVIVAA